MKFKQCTSFILAVMMLVSNAGLAFNVHYCGGEIASVNSVYGTDESCFAPEIIAVKACCAEAAKDHKSCCDDKTVEIQDDSDDIIVKIFSVEIGHVFIVPSYNYLQPATFLTPLHESGTSYQNDSNAPPFFKLYQQYIFYA